MNPYTTMTRARIQPCDMTQGPARGPVHGGGRAGRPGADNAVSTPKRRWPGC